MIQVIGLNHPQDLPVRVRDLIEKAKVLAGSRRHLSYFKDHPGEKIPFFSPVEDFLEEIRRRLPTRVALLLSGDPLFFGLGRRLCQTFPPEVLSFHPAPSAIQLAFARLKMPWDEARIISLHARGFQNLHLEIAPYERVAFFTDPQNTPARIARYLLQKGLRARVFVCEELGLPEERIHHLSLEEAAERDFSPLNVMILCKEAQRQRLLFGLPEEHYLHEGGMITKAEVRAAIVSHLAPFPEAVVWDLGAGSGAVGLELARLCFRGRTYLVERDPKRIEIIQKNLSRSGLDNVEIVKAEIKEVVRGLPTPDLVFVGGGMRAFLEVLDPFLERFPEGGRLAATFITLEPLLAALKSFEKRGLAVSFSSFFLARGKAFPGDIHGLLAHNPVFLLTARRKR